VVVVGCVVVCVVVVGGCVVVVVDDSEVVDEGVPVSDAVDDGELPGAWVSVVFDGAGLSPLGGAVLTLGVGVLGALPAA
jgi:hypothetical protein